MLSEIKVNPADFPPGYLDRHLARAAAAPGAGATPLPGPVRGVFAPEPAKAAGHTLRPVKLGDWVILTQLANPFAEMYVARPGGKDPAIGLQDVLIAGWVFTVSYEEAARVAAGPDPVRTAWLAALEKFSAEEMLAFAQELGAALVQNFTGARATALEIGAVDAKGGAGNFTVTAPPTTGLVGGQASTAPCANSLASPAPKR